MNRRRATLAIGATLALLLMARHPSADIRIETHEVTDLSPRRMQAAVDLGMMAFSVLVTWTANTAR